MRNLKKIETVDDLSVVRKRPNLVLVNSTKEVLYNATPKGVYVEHIDGTLYTESEWKTGGFTGDMANGVAVITDNCRFVIAKEDAATSVKWSEKNVLIQGVTTVSTNEESYKDYNGKANTEAMLVDGNQPAANACNEYVFPNGKIGYLPAMGEWREVWNNRRLVISYLTLIEAETIREIGMWSSTQTSETYAFMCSMDYSSSGFGANVKSKSVHARAFTTL